MLGPNDPSVGNDGIMFEQFRDQDWPCATDCRAYDIPAELFDWLVIARDPRYDLYCNDAHEAMDQTNYGAIVGSLPIVSVWHPHRSGAGWQNVPEALAAGIATIDIGTPYGHCLLIDPTTTDLADEMIRLRNALADYPLLDEQAYSERQWQAWTDYAPTAWRDEIWQLRGRHHRAIDRLSEELDTLDANEVVSACQPFLNWEDGFDGTYEPSFLSILRSVGNKTNTVEGGQEDAVVKLYRTLSKRAQVVLQHMDV